MEVSSHSPGSARRLQLNPQGLGCSHSPRLSRCPPYLAHAPHDAELLCVDEALQHHPDGHVDIVLHHVIAQVHAGVRLGHADHGFDVPHRDGDAARCLRAKGRRQHVTEGYKTWGKTGAFWPRIQFLSHCRELSAPLRVTQAKEALPPAGTATQPGTVSLFI